MNFCAFGLRAVLGLAFAAGFLQGCGKSDLTRSVAGDQINKSAEIAKLALNVPIHDSAIEQGIAQGFWRVDNSLISAVSDVASAEISNVSGVSITLRNPGTISVEVTGITDMPIVANGKEVKFAWHYTELPRLAKRLAVAGGSGFARFRLYDDGWRIESVQCYAGRVPMTLTAEEAKQRDDDVVALAERRQAEEAARSRAAEALTRKQDEQRASIRRLTNDKVQIVQFVAYPDIWSEPIGWPSTACTWWIRWEDGRKLLMMVAGKDVDPAGKPEITSRMKVTFKSGDGRPVPCAIRFITAGADPAEAGQPIPLPDYSTASLPAVKRPRPVVTSSPPKSQSPDFSNSMSLRLSSKDGKIAVSVSTVLSGGVAQTYYGLQKDDIIRKVGPAMVADVVQSIIDAEILLKKGYENKQTIEVIRGGQIMTLP